MTSAARPGAFRFVSADVSGKTHIGFLFFLLSGEPDFFRINDNDKISRVDVWRENRFFFPAQQIGSLYSDAPEHLASALMTHHLRGTSVAFAEKVFMAGKKSTKATVGQANVNLPSGSLGRQLLHFDRPRIKTPLGG